MTIFINATDARKEWSKFIDDVKWIKPAFVKRNRDVIAVLPIDLLEFILKDFKLTVNVHREDDGTVTGVFKELDLMANSSNLESLKSELAKELLEYSEEYINEFRLYYNSPNRKGHFPYVYRTLIVSDDFEKVKNLFGIAEKPLKKVL